MWGVNLNQKMKVKLSDFGKDVYYHQYDEVNEKIKSLGGKPIVPTMPKVDAEGYTTFQMWQFMNLYGEHMTMGATQVLETLDVIIVEGWIVEEGDSK